MRYNILKNEYKNELRSNIIWSVAISFYVILTIIMFPFIEETMPQMMEALQSIPGMEQWFSLSEFSQTDLLGFYGMEAGTILIVGGSIYAGLIGGKILAKEESNGTIEYLASQPISRKEIFLNKMFVVVLNILIFNLFIFLISILPLKIVDKDINLLKASLFNLFVFVLHIQIALVSFFVSLIKKKSNLSMGLIIALVSYFSYTILSLLDNELFNFIQLLLPYSYSDPSNTLGNTIDPNYISLLIGFLITSVLGVYSYIKYSKKDLV